MRKPSAIPLLLLFAALLVAFWAFLQAEPTVRAPAKQADLVQEVAATDLADPAEMEQAESREVVQRESSPASPLEELTARPQGIPLLFLKATGGPAAHVSVIPWFGEALGEIVVTDEKGEATLPSYQGSGGFAIYPKNGVPIYMEFEFSKEAITVIIEDGYRLAGRINFKQPRRRTDPMYLSIGSGNGSASVVPQSLQQELSSKVYVSKIAHVEVKADGNFEWTGLPYDWSGTITARSGYLLCACSSPGEIDDRGKIKLVGLSENLQIDATELPFFFGRVVTPNGKQGVEGIDLMGVSYVNAERMNGAMVFAETKAGGYFEMPTAAMNQQMREDLCGPTKSVTPFDLELEIRGNEQWGGLSLELHQEGKEDPWNLGDIPLVAWSTLAFRVVDQQGKPIQGALAYTGTMSEPTTEDGIGLVRFEPEVESVSFGARGFSTKTYAMEEVEEEPLEVKLQVAASVFIHWNVPEEANLLGLKVALNGEEGIFEEDGMSFGPDWRFRMAFGIKSKGGRGRSGVFQSTGWPLKKNQNHLELWGLRPNVPLTLGLSDLMATVLDEQEFTLKPGEHRDVALELAFAPTVFQGKVFDEVGIPVAGAHARLASKSNYSLGKSTDSLGEFVFAGIGSKTVSLSVKKQGHVNFFDPAFAVPASGIHAIVVLKEARELVVYLQTPSGKTMPSGWFELPGGRLGSQQEIAGDGTLLPAAPVQAFTLYWMIGGKSGEVEVPANVLEYTIKVPEMATVTVRVLRSAVQEDGAYRVEIVPQGFLLGYDKGYISRSFHLKPEELEKEWTLQALLPGSYVTRFFLRATNGDGVREDRLLQETGPFEIVAGENPPLVFVD